MHQDLPLTRAESERQHRALAGLRGYLAAVQKFRQANRPTADSYFVRATKENGGLWWRETGDLPLAAAFDHLEAFRTLLGGPIPRQAGYSVLRGSAEAAAIAWWVFDPDASEAERVQRGFEERLHGIHSQRGLVERSKERLRAQHDELVAEAANFGLSEQSDSRKEGLTHFGKPRLGIQDLLVRALPDKPPESSLANGEILWRMLSAWSHSEIWTNFVGVQEADDDTMPRVLTVHLPTLLRMAELTVRVHDAAFSRRMQLTGHTTWEQERGTLSPF
jgi:hypothetical protein